MKLEKYKATLARARLVAFVAVLCASLTVVDGVRAENTIPLDELRLFSDVFVRVKNDYVDVVDDRKLIEDAIDGMMGGLDPHSRYMRKKEYEDLKISTTGKFGGLGIQFVMDENRVRVVSIIAKGPSEKAGLKRGDLITKLDGQDVAQMNMDKAVNTMRGKVGTKITLSVEREETEPFDVVVTRDTIKIESIKTAMYTPKIGYVRITNFQNKTGHALRQKLTQKRSQNKGLKGVILDLRGNPGGVLESAVRVSDLFLKRDQLIVYTKGRIPGSSLQFKTTNDDFLKGLPIVVLINRGSASASEIVSGALQDHKRAVIMGGTSFGKASVQTVHPLRKDRALRLTTAKYYTPLGRSINGQGIEPDITIEPLPREELEARAKKLEEQYKPWEIDLAIRIREDHDVQRAAAQLNSMIAKLAGKPPKEI